MRRIALAVAGVPLLVAGCGSSAGMGTAAHDTPGGQPSGGASMAGDVEVAAAPSETASMICGEEIREAVAHTLTVPEVPAGTHTWRDRLYRCGYRLGAGELRLSVKDLDTAAPGKAYFQGLRARLPGATVIKGLSNFGFPAFETHHGDVVFIKDHKTLWVDASRLSPARLPDGMAREDVAYGVAAAVIGCWTE
ncbi:hypothetical protein [Nocardioides sp. Iso805N]|uniref:hypothetical protein n=1 Tax=Nocardioides sp. Iso805N TaxID=1283287 RepID=UPI0012F70F73|nr:hypothetical protein [Nocardioides sp. Iso805N]